MIKEISEKLGEKSAQRAEIIAQQRFGGKEKLKKKFYQGILEGYIDISKEWTSDYMIENLKEKIESASDNEKKIILKDVLKTYDAQDPKIRVMLKRYEKFIDGEYSGGLKIIPN